MPRSYRHIKQYEKEILELRKQGLTHREIGEKYGLRKEQIKDFLKQSKKREEKIKAGKAIERRGRPCKKEGDLPPSIQKLDKLTQMRYVIASKDRQIQRLEMENELMRDFLSLTERK